MVGAKEIVIENGDGEHILIHVGTNRNAEGWFGAEVRVQCDGWCGRPNASFFGDELTAFAKRFGVFMATSMAQRCLSQLSRSSPSSLRVMAKGTSWSTESPGRLQGFFVCAAVERSSLFCGD